MVRAARRGKGVNKYPLTARETIESSIEIDLCAKFSVQSDFESFHFVSIFIQLILNILDLFVDGLLIFSQRFLRLIEW